MPINLPQLDNRTFADLLKELTATIPKYSGEWSNFNPSDPGITILELLTWITEGLIYRTNQVPVQSYLNFLKLVAGTEVYDPTDKDHKNLQGFLSVIESQPDKADIETIKAEAQKFLNSRYTAVTEKDFKTLALEAAPDELKRVEVFTSDEKWLNLLLVLKPETDAALKEALIAKVKDYLTPRSLLGTLLYIRAAEFTQVDLRITIVCESYAKSRIFGGQQNFAAADDLSEPLVENQIAQRIFEYADAILGGPDRTGWPLKRGLMIYELFQIIESVEGIKYVKNIDILSPVNGKFPLKIPELIHLNKLIIEIPYEHQA